MPCYHPLQAWRTQSNTVAFGTTPNGEFLPLPCGKCIGCRTAKAKAWALRCHLELQRHSAALFTTLTYNDEHRAPTLRRRDLQLAIKRIRRATTQSLRFFACGEYGTTRGRPHYHAIIYGLSEEQGREVVDRAWQPRGYTTTLAINAARIAYTAGYTAKKITESWEAQTKGLYQELLYKLPRDHRVDAETGEIYKYQAPFLQMSRRPGIGGHVRQWPHLWRLVAITPTGQPMAVPRFLHEAWKQNATEQQLQELLDEKKQFALNRDAHNYERLEAGEQIALAQAEQKAERRKLA